MNADKSLKVGVETNASQAIAEQERYNKTLEAMAKRQAEAAQATKELADAEAMRALKAEAAANATARAEKAASAALHERNVNSLEAAHASQEAAKSVKVLGEEDVKAALASTESTNRWTVSKNQLKAAAKGLALEFPLVGRAFAFMSNPITAGLAGIAAAIALWRYRMQELTATFAETEIAAVKITNRERVNAMAEEWKTFGDELDKIREKYTGFEAQQDRILDKLKQQGDLMRQLAGDLSPADKAALDESIARDQAYGESKAGLAFGVSARNKEAEARRLTEELNRTTAGLDPKKREQMLAAIDAESQAAGADLSKGNERLDFLKEAENASWWTQGTNFKFASRYGKMSVQEARALEQDRIARAQERLDAAGRRREYLETGGARGERLRGRISELLTGAAADRAKEAELNQQAVGTQSSADLAAGVARFQSGQPLTVTPTGAGQSVMPQNVAAIMDAARRTEAALARITEYNIRVAAAAEAAANRLQNRSGN